MRPTILQVDGVAAGGTEGFLKERGDQRAASVDERRHRWVRVLHYIEQAAEDLRARAIAIVQHGKIALRLQPQNNEGTAVVHNPRGIALAIELAGVDRLRTGDTNAAAADIFQKDCSTVSISIQQRRTSCYN